MNLKEIRERDQWSREGGSYPSAAHYDRRDLLQALDEARPVMEWLAGQGCDDFNQWTLEQEGCPPSDCGNCPPCQARAWKKKYYPKEKK